MKDYINLENYNRNKKNKKRIIGLIILLIILIFIYILISMTRLEYINISGSKLYTQDQLKSYIIKSPFDRNTIFIRFVNKVKRNYNIPYIKKVDIKYVNRNTIDVNLTPKEDLFQIKNDNSYVDVDSKLNVEGITKKRNDSLLLLSGNRIKLDSTEYSKPAINDEDLVNDIKLITKSIMNAKIKDFKTLICNNDSYILRSKKIDVRLGDNTNLDKKMNVLLDAYSKIANLSGTLFLDDYSDNIKQFRFKKNID